jgi:hypothetical protein
VSDFKWHAGSARAVATELRRGVVRGLEKSGIGLQKGLKTITRKGGGSNIGSGGQSSRPGGPPAVDTGDYSRSMQIDRSRLDDRTPRIKVGTNRPQAKTLEYGGVIKAKGGALPVPFPGNEKRAKQLRRKAGTSLYNLPKGTLVMITRKGKPPLLVEPQADGSWRPVFILKKSVRIAARPHFRPVFKGARKATLKIVLVEFEKSIRKISA